VTTFLIATVAGCLLRYGSELAADVVLGTSRLWATMTVNIVGSALIGLAFGHVIGHGQAVVPFCGGLTSYSAAFAGPFQAWQLGQRRHAVLSLVITPVACTICFALAAQL
jgi:CrcB protein